VNADIIITRGIVLDDGGGWCLWRRTVSEYYHGALADWEYFFL
jgi:hypothetical protein